MSARQWLPAGWNRTQRSVVIGLLLVLCGYLAIRLWINPRFVPDPQPPVPDLAADLADRIDPNTADVATLAALPMIGPKRARAIVAHRDEFVATHPGERAFQTVNDLDKVKGIGPIIVTQLEPFLLFDGKQPATQP